MLFTYILSILIAVFGSFTFAQDIPVQGSSDSSVVQQLDMNIVKNNKINQIILKFCDEGFDQNLLKTSLDISMRPYQKKRLCVVVANQSDEPISLLPEVVSAKLDEHGNFVCSDKQPLSGDTFVSSDNWENPMVLKAHQQAVKYITLATTRSSSGSFYGCLTLSLSDLQRMGDNSPLYLKIRKAISMDILVQGKMFYFQWFYDIVWFVKTNVYLISWIGLILCSLGLLVVVSGFFQAPKNLKVKKSSKHKK